MIALLWLVLAILASPLKSQCQHEAENVTLRQQVVVLRRQVCDQVRLTNFDRLVLVKLYLRFPSILKVLAIVQPEIVGTVPDFAATSSAGNLERGKGGRPLKLIYVL